MTLDPNNLTGEKLSDFSAATDLTGIFLAAFKPGIDNYNVDVNLFAFKSETYTKQQVTQLLQALSNTLTAQIKAIKQTYKYVYEPQAQSNTISDVNLKGGELLMVVVDNMVNEDVTLNSTTGILDFSGMGGVYPGNKITVLINKSGQ